MSLATLARSSLKQFITIYSEVHAENGDQMTDDQLESLMWEKIIAGAKSSGSKIPSNLLKKLKVQLPYLPEIINYVGCPALKPCGGLYVPCGTKQSEGEQFCTACSKHSAKYGSLAERGAAGTYTDPNDKHEISYGTWLAKNETTIEDVYKELAANGFTFEIPSDQLAVNAKRAEPKRRPGRPGVVKKTKVNSDGTESPIGTPLDGPDAQVILPESSDSGEESEGTKEVKAKVKGRKAAAEKEPKKEKPAKEPKKPAKEPKKEKAETDPKKAEKKEKKAPVPKKKQAAKPAKDQLNHESDEEEDDDRKQMINGKNYIICGANIHDLDGYQCGTIVDGEPVWIDGYSP